MIADTTHIPAIGMPERTSKLEEFSPPIAFTGMGTAAHISLRVSVDVSTVLTFVVVG